MSNSKSLRGVIALPLSSINSFRMFPGFGTDLVPTKAKGFGVFVPERWAGVKRAIRCSSSFLGDDVRFQPMKNGGMFVTHSAKISNFGFAPGLKICITRGGVIKVLEDEGYDDEIVAQQMADAARVAAPVSSAPALLASPTSPLLTTPEPAAAGMGNVNSAVLIANIPTTGSISQLRSKNVLPVPLQPVTDYPLISAEAIEASTEVKFLYHIASCGDMAAGPLKLAFAPTMVDGVSVAATPAEIAERLGALPVTNAMFNTSASRQLTIEGVDSSCLRSNPQVMFEDSVTPDRVRAQPWHKGFALIVDYDPSTGGELTPPQLTGPVIEAMPSSFTANDLGKCPANAMLSKHEIGCGLVLAVAFPAIFVKSVRAFNSRMETISSATLNNGKSTNLPTAEFKGVVEIIKKELAEQLPGLVNFASQSVVLTYLRVFLSFSRTLGSQPDRYSFGPAAEHMVPVRAATSLCNSALTVGQALIKKHGEELTGLEVKAINDALATAVDTLRSEHPLLRISALVAGDLPSNLATGLAAERNVALSVTVRAQVVRRFMIAYRSFMLYLYCHNRPLFDSLVAK